MSKSKSGFIYIWYDRKHKRFYIGSHWGTPDDGYICSSNWMRDAYRRRPQDFKRRIIKTMTNRIDLLKEEDRYLSMIKPEEKKIRYYNLARGGTGHWTVQDNHLSVREKMSKSIKKKFKDPEYKKSYMEGRKKLPPQTEETKRKRSESMKATMAKKYPIEDRKQRMEFNSPEYNEVMRQHSAKRWQDPEYKKRVGKNISESLKGFQARLGQTTSEEHKRKLSESNKGYVWWNDGTNRKKSKICPGDGWTRGLPIR